MLRRDVPLHCSRRRLLLAGTAPVLARAMTSCAELGGDRDAGPGAGRLAFRSPSPPRPDRDRERTGFFHLQGSPDCEPAQVHVPRAAAGGFRLVVVLHGANGHPRRALHLLRPYADARGFVLLAPKSYAATWDVLAGGFGPDVENLDALLRRVSRLAPLTAYSIAGFSDGASYALTLGLTNGDLFDSVVAFSPGFEAADERHGRPRFFVSHGVQDPVLPIERCSRRIVPALQEDGYEVTYEEFAGGHAIPVGVRRQAAGWLGSSGGAGGNGSRDRTSAEGGAGRPVEVRDAGGGST